MSARYNFDHIPLGITVPQGSQLGVKATFTPSVLAPDAVSSAVTFILLKPDNTTTVVTSPDSQITVPDTDPPTENVWYCTFTDPLDQHGDYFVRAESTAGLIAVYELRVEVTPRAVPVPTP